MPINMSGPVFQVLPPAPSQLTVVPVQGPVGPQGPQGDPGDPGSTLGFTHSVSPSMTTVLINHNLVFQPAGILCLDTAGDTILGATVTYPQAGWIELEFGVPFIGTIFLS